MEYLSTPPDRSDDWKTEYDQLSEDYRHYVAMGWQATVAVLIADGVVAGLSKDITSFFLLLLAFWASSGLTIMIGIETLKWTVRGQDRARILREIDEARGFRRFLPPEQDFRRWPVGEWLACLVFVVGMLMAVAPFLLLLTTIP